MQANLPKAEERPTPKVLISVGYISAVIG